MIIKQITFDRGVTVDAAHISNTNEIQKAFELLGLARPKSVLVLVGGAGGIDLQDQAAVRKAIHVVAKLAEETGSLVIDGGTQAGVMLEIGEQRKQNKCSFPLIGVLPEGKIAQKDPLSILDSNHTHFFFVPGDQWGDESAWITKIATGIAGNQKSMTILVNGGKVSRLDVDFSLKENRPTIIMRGTGRLADEMTLNDNIIETDTSKTTEEMLAFLRSKLS